MNTAASARPTPAPAPGPAGMASAEAPPFIVPGEHFTAALVFFALGAVGLFMFARELAAGAYPSPRVIGVTHFFTLGWITTSIMGALYQFLPVALGRPIRSLRVAHITFGLHVIGLPLFIMGLLIGPPTVIVVGALALATGLALFAANLGMTLAVASRRDATWWALAGAALFLGVTLVVGAALAGNLRWGYLGADRFVALGVHLHVALGGWVLLVVVGVGNRLLPMFLLSHGVGDGPARAAVAFISAGAATLVAFHHGPVMLARWVPAALLATGLGCWLFQARRFYRRRIRKSLDPGMRLAAVALVILALALVLAAPVAIGRADPRLATTYVLVVVGGFSLFVAALYYKIVPFLVWYHRFGHLAGRQPVPKVSELFDAGTASVAAVLLAGGIGGLAAGVAAGSVLGVRIAAVALAAGVLIECSQMLLLSRRRPA